MKVEDFAKKEPMAMPGFTVLTPKQETEYEKMIREQQSGCVGCGDERPAYPVPILPPPLQDVPTETGKKNSKR